MTRDLSRFDPQFARKAFLLRYFSEKTDSFFTAKNLYNSTRKKAQKKGDSGESPLWFGSKNKVGQRTATAGLRRYQSTTRCTCVAPPANVTFTMAIPRQGSASR